MRRLNERIMNWPPGAAAVNHVQKRQVRACHNNCKSSHMKVPLSQIAHTRSGDKGDTCNVGVIALEEKDYPTLLREVTADRVKQHFGELVKGEVERFELPNLGALNFLLHQALGGGGTLSLRTDAQGKTFGAALLSLEIEVP